MYVFVMLVFIFCIGAICGYLLEVLYRHFADSEKHWYNPGFCVGPWLPIYGVGLITVFLITYLNENNVIENDILRHLILFAFVAICMTLIELVGGILLLKYFNLRLWDYTNEKFNFKGFICLKFSFFWMLLAALYYFFIHPKVYESVIWLSHNLIFTFFVGFIFGVFVIDLIYSGNVIAKIRTYAIESGIVVKFDDLKSRISREIKIRDSKAAFFIFMLKENILKAIKEQASK